LLLLYCLALLDALPIKRTVAILVLNGRIAVRNSTDLEKALERFLPPAALEKACAMLRAYPHHLIISQPRSTKHGDFRTGHRGDRHEITVNGNLNNYAFLITLMHELAHLVAHVKFGGRIQPHGAEWKQCFRETLTPFVGADVFPPDVDLAVKIYLRDPGATTHSDFNLAKALSRYDKHSSNVVILDDLPMGALFEYGKDRKLFKKGPQLRKRYECKEQNTGAIYLFDPLAKVKHV
jgi:hypothetical protein